MYRTRKNSKKYAPKKNRQQIISGERRCPFCHVQDTEIVVSHKNANVIRNIHPYQFWELMSVTDHLMIAPTHHVEALHELTKAERHDIIDLIAAYEKQGYNVYAREPGNITKTVLHQHTHLIKTAYRPARLFVHLRRPYFLLQR